ncbi:GNAT family N-acetyltransferase [Oceanirhabdus sp. W0125-5]|uniref:GNAT family N-acetyltransferase n=1 Tax=Oceanirhabdus sp. W0125-5 TaxID=2999116 RepID=UPI0022F2E8A1|nr:GNAT family N-acetyltransferase [Oceanirhabdus sp. W0125-5]WBW97060.1 GNAT family N-acetyltransferase [Oceanirhabdus sp. W0125-5]
MIRRKENPYKKCPIYETNKFILRLVEENDAEDLLECYSDSVAVKFFNSDNCTSNFIYKTLDEMKNCIKFWIEEYKNQYYVRFSIVDKTRGKAIGTIEMFAKDDYVGEYGKVGVLRLDLATRYEKVEVITEVLDIIEDNFYCDFEVENIITKAIPEAKERVAALKNCGFRELEPNTVVSYDSYYIKSKME